MCASYGEQIAYSYDCNFTFVKEKESIIAGPENSLPTELNDTLLLSNFWLEQTEKIPLEMNVNIESRGAIREDLKVDISNDIYSPDLAKLWPDCPNSENSRGQFAAILPEQIDDFSLNCVVSCEQSCISKIFIGNSRYVKKDSEGSLSKFEVTKDSIIFTGELWSVFPNSPKIFIISNNSLNLIERSERNELNQPYLKWFSEVDDEMRYGSLVWREDNRFELTIPIDYFSRYPGSVKLAYFIENSLQSFDGLSNRLISHIVNDALEKRHPYSGNDVKMAGRRIYRTLSKASLVPENRNIGYTENFFENSIDEPSVNMIAGFHNFSMTEGAPKVFYNIVKTMDAKNIKIVSFKDGLIGSELTALGFDVDVFSNLNIVELTKIKYQSAFLQCVEYFRKVKPKFIFINSIDSFLLADVAWRLKIPVVWLIHESVSPTKSYHNYPQWIRWRYIKALTKATKVIFVSEETRKIFLTLLDDNRTSVIKNGLDLEFFCGEVNKYRDLQNAKEVRLGDIIISDKDVVFLSVGTTTERKGQDRTLRELAMLKEIQPSLNWKFIIVGGRDLPYCAYLRSEIERLGLPDLVLIVPETADVHRYYALADFFILNSREESSPLVILEAMAAKIPMISTAVFGLKELLIDHFNALVFDGEKEKDITSKLLESLSNQSLMNEIKENAFRFVSEKYSLEGTLANYKELISDFNSWDS